MSFGFSAGDLVAALKLVATVIDALRDSGDASSQNRELLRELDSLETALIRVKRLDIDDELNAEVIALYQAAGQCQKTIQEFWQKIRKYQPSLQAGRSNSRVKGSWMRIQWALCKKDDIIKFKADLVGHTESIQLLLTTIHMATASLHDRRQSQRHETLAGKIQMSYFGVMRRLTKVTGAFARSMDQGRQILDMTREVIRMNVNVFEVVLSIQKLITEIPGQVQRQQPVFLIDALGKASPFHLEFIRSSDALVAVLAENLKKYGRGAELIKRGNFVISDISTNRDIDLSQDWELCFFPGQRVDMSMVFDRQNAATSSCPRCKQECNGATDEDIECPSCHMLFRRIIEQVAVSNEKQVDSTDLEGDAGITTHSTENVPEDKPNIQKRKREVNADEEMAWYRKVRIRKWIGNENDPILHLVPRNGTFEPKMITVPYPPETLRIGRQTNAKTVPTPTNGYFDSKVVSRQHAEIWADQGGKIWIRDKKSSNGTYVNGTRLSMENQESDPHLLQSQDHLELGIDIVSEDQQSIVYFRVSATVEHAGPV